MEKNRVTIYEIAKALGIDSSTVSRALNDSSRVSQKTKNKVLKKAGELGYQRNMLASNLRKSRGNTIGVVVPRIARHFFSESISGIEDAAFSAGYNVLICQSLEQLEREQRITANLIANQVDGILISISMESNDCEHLDYFEKHHIPLVFFDRYCKSMPSSSKVLGDDFRASRDAVEHLVRNGCTRIAHLSGPQNLEIYRNRFLGYKAALEHHMLPYDEQLVVVSRLMEEDGYGVMKDFYERKTAIDGVFSANDTAAIGAMKYLKEHHIGIPDEIALVGFSNEPVSEVIEPALSTIDQSGFAMGKIACELLIEKIEKREEVENRTITLEASFVERASSLRKRKG
ncbi:LacI family DNA-binding transcriptional regulator [Sinomicrobium soli]|uniref:LacI family DNA-binding transcriptional regulator n=1 Tax=Sinomicrobium sp. N-1-3-6 TaxID=2219864 RepID=UPI000DCE05C2|nr:LacI family DNA-binding transcriptional regulator [Sinomicrobium sp. N-1-3-6]RAV28241.1 LacI family transcriptional regulator [Sinomicrobium sp. N-1-3-6]